MKDEEMAKQFADNISGLGLTCSLLSAKDKNHAYRLGRYDGFLAGLKAGRPQWHDLRKDPNDLPKEPRQYLCQIECYVGSAIIYECSYYDAEYDSWSDSYGDVIAWSELPTFDKE